MEYGVVKCHNQSAACILTMTMLSLILQHYTKDANHAKKNTTYQALHALPARILKITDFISRPLQKKKLAHFSIDKILSSPKL